MFIKESLTTRTALKSLAVVCFLIGFTVGCGGGGSKKTTEEANQAPSISGNYPTSVDVGVAYDFTPTASDADSDSLTFTIENMPEWAAFETTSGRLSGTPEQQDVGEYSNISVSVSDGESSDSTSSFTITVNSTNVAPTIEDQNLSVEVSTELVITLGQIEDSDGDTISYQVSGTDNTVAGSESNQIIYSSTSSGTETFTVTASDGVNTPVEATITVIVTTPGIATYFISPNGSDSNDGTSAQSPWLSFGHAFNTNSGGMEGGDELILLSGTYSIANGTGILRGVDDNGNALEFSAAIPSGINREFPTVIRAAVAGEVTIEGSDDLKPIFIGRSFRKDQYITVDGMLFEGGGSMYNSQYVIFRNSGFHGSLSIGTNAHSEGNSYNLIEDVWVWATNRRIIAINYRSDNNVWRRVVVRSEGCDEAGCEGAPKADPSVGITVYDSQNVSMQNILVVDRQLRDDVAYADFATAQHTEDDFHLGRNEWLGNMSVNSDDSSLTFEADFVMGTGDPIWTIKNFVAVGSARTGANIGNKPYNYDTAGKPTSIIENATVILSSPGDNISGIRVTPDQSNVTVKNSVTVNATRTGYNALASTVENSAGYNPSSANGNFDAGSCTGECVDLASDPTSDGSYLYPLRVETSSNVDLAIDGVSLGATVVSRYGAEGSTYGDENYNALSSEALWPWPNEERIKKEMCLDQGVTRGFCSTDKRLDGTNLVTLTSYVWEFLGSEIPADIYQ